MVIGAFFVNTKFSMKFILQFCKADKWAACTTNLHQQICFRRQSHRRPQTVAHRQLEPKKLIQGIDEGKKLPLFDPLGSS